MFLVAENEKAQETLEEQHPIHLLLHFFHMETTDASFSPTMMVDYNFQSPSCTDANPLQRKRMEIC